MCNQTIKGISSTIGAILTHTVWNLNNFLDKNFGGTPMVIITKDSNLIGNENQDGWIGESSYEDFSKFLESVGY